MHRGPGGLFFTRTTYHNPPRRESGGPSNPVNPASGLAMMHRFWEMVEDLGPPGAAAENPRPSGARVTHHHTTIHPGGGTTGFTITTAPVNLNRGGPDVASDFNLYVLPFLPVGMRHPHSLSCPSALCKGRVLTVEPQTLQDHDGQHHTPHGQ
jgi:hypothetical protein